MPFRRDIARLTGEVKALKFKIEQQSAFNESNLRAAEIVREGIEELRDSPLFKDPALRGTLDSSRGELGRNQRNFESFLGELIAEYEARFAELEYLIEFQAVEEAQSQDEMADIYAVLDELRSL